MRVNRCLRLSSQEVNMIVKQVKWEPRLWSDVGTPLPSETQAKASICVPLSVPQRNETEISHKKSRRECWS